MKNRERKYYFMLEMYWRRIGDGPLEGPFGSVAEVDEAVTDRAGLPYDAMGDYSKGEA